MMDRGTHLLDITLRDAFGHQELRQDFDKVTTVTLEPPLIDIEVIVRAVVAVATRPLQCVKALKARNAAVILKGIALGQWAREHRVSHVHSYWISAATNVAFIASSIAGVHLSANLPVRVPSRPLHIVGVRLHGAASTGSVPLRPTIEAARAYDRAKTSSLPSQGVLA